MRTASIFAALGFVYCAVSALGLYWFFGPEGQNLSVAGIGSAAQLLIFPPLGALAAWASARRLFAAEGEASAGSRFLRGAAVGVLTFVTCVVVQAAISAAQTDIKTGFWLFVAMLLFGGLALGVPGALVSGATAVFIGRK